MAELSEAQVELAAMAMKEADAAPIGIEHYRSLARVAAPFLQLPWDEPTDEEIAEITKQHWHWKGSLRHISEDVRFVAGQFVQRRNAVLIPKPVVETIEEQLMGARNACRMALNAFERNDAIDWAKVEKYAAPEFHFGFTGFKPLDDLVIAGPLKERRSTAEVIHSAFSDDDPRREKISEALRLSEMYTANREQTIDRVLAALDEVK